MATALRILCVEDSEADMLLLLPVLQEGGYDPVCERVETAEAMSAALDARGWDVVIADYSMPQFTAVAALQVLQARDLDLPFIVVSGAIGEDTAVTVMKAGAHDFLLKSNLARLVPAVERELRETATRRAKRAAELALHDAYAGLENLVQQRTAELEATNRALQAEVDKRIRAERRMVAQHHITQALAESTGLADAIPKVLRATCNTLGWDLGQFWLLDHQTQVLRLMESWHPLNQTFPNFERSVCDRTFTKGVGMLGRIWETRRPLWIPDLAADSTFVGAEIALQDKLLNACGFPIINNGEVLGSMTFFCRRVRQPEPELLKVMRTIGSQVGQFIKRRQAENALHQLAAIVESSDDAIISTHLDRTVVSWNAGAEKLYGYSATEAIGQNIVNLIRTIDTLPPPPLDINSSCVDYQQVIHRCKNGNLVDVFLTVSPVKDSVGNIVGISMIARDISDRRAIEKMKDEFVSIVSHELRTPLTSIRGSLGLLLSGKLGELSEEGTRFLQIAVNNTDRLVRLINDILDLERLESGKINLCRKRCNIAELVIQASEVMQTIAEKANITLQVASLNVPVWVDADLILQALTNLLSNAIKFSPAGTIVKLTTAIALPQKCWLDPSPTQGLKPEYLAALPISCPHLVVLVQDEGRGIPADKIDSIFERFQQVDASDSRQKGGTGLGLAICRSIIQQHGGRIWVNSEVGNGSTFFLALPIDSSK